MDLNKKIRKLAVSLGADYFGVADLTPAHDFILEQGGPRIAGYPRAVSVGIRLLDSVVDMLPQRREHAAAMIYRHHTYDVVNACLDQVALQVANALQRAGYEAFPVPASIRADDNRICAVFTHKLAAHLPGLAGSGRTACS